MGEGVGCATLRLSLPRLPARLPAHMAVDLLKDAMDGPAPAAR